MDGYGIFASTNRRDGAGEVRGGDRRHVSTADAGTRIQLRSRVFSRHEHKMGLLAHYCRTTRTHDTLSFVLSKDYLVSRKLI